MTKLDMKDMLKDSMKEGGKRNGVRTVVSGAVSGVDAMLKATDSENAEKVAAVLKTKIGEAFVKSAVGYAIPFIPQLKGNKIAEVVGEECRNQGAEDIQQDFMAKVMEHIVPSVMSAFEKSQNNPAVRVLMEDLQNSEEEQESAKEEVKSSKSK